jgi:hypothetical protein
MAATDRARRNHLERTRLRKLVARRFPSIAPTWRGFLRSGIYVPSEAESHLSGFGLRGPEAFLGELERLAALGAPWACAVLGYQALLLAKDGTRDPQRAIQLCADAAVRGDAYAQYILAWAQLLAGDALGAAATLRKSALQLFPPAILDTVTLFWNGWGVAKSADSRILELIEQASIIGHRATLIWRCTIYRSGKLGTLRRLVGYGLRPVAKLAWKYSTWRAPFSARVFVFDARESGSIFLHPWR